MQTAIQADSSGHSLLLSQGYGYIPKAVMQDRNLSTTAKALYAYLSSFCGTGSTAWPSVDKICFDLDIGRTAFYSAMKGLKGSGYIGVERVKDRGRFSRCVYTLASELPLVEQTSFDAPCAGDPAMDAPGTDHPKPGEPCTGKPTANNNSFNNTTPKNNTSKDDDDDSPAMAVQPPCHQTGTGRAAQGEREPERQRIAQMMAQALGGKPGPELLREANRAAVGDVFRRCYGRPALAAELEALAGLLAQCELDAMSCLLRKSAEHAPSSPAPYIKKMAQKYRSDAIAYGFIKRSFERLTQWIVEQVDDKNEGFR